jgi:hypothetical protein
VALEPVVEQNRLRDVAGVYAGDCLGLMA